ncbi:MAG: hypothetical protein R8M71_02385 [Alphaproteobacteria bacterium]|jgi:hypothetical protein|nr:hypothetical protein [Alphaproteobacteria bacterium]
MIIIAFSDRTSKILPRILCHGMKHVAPIGVYQDKLIMYQFIKPGKINQIRLSMRDLQILQRHGWRFIYLTGDLAYNFNNTNAKTCVQLSKHAIGIKNIYIQTPNSLYKHLLSD